MFRYHFLIFFNNRFYKFQFRRLQAIVLDQCNRKQGEFSAYIPFDDMNMYRLMVIREKHKTKTK